MSVWGSMTVSVMPSGARRVSDALAQELEEVVSCPTWVLGAECGSSRREYNTLKPWAISPGSRSPV